MFKDFKIHFLNTIWSDSMIIESKDKYAFIDTASGFYYPMITEYLNKINVKDFEFIILTHFHSDHYSNVAKIINDYNVKKLYLKHYSGHESTDGSGLASSLESHNKERAKYDEIMASAKNKNVEVIFLDEINKDFDIKFGKVTLELYDNVNHLEELYSNKESEFYEQERFSENGNSIGIGILYNKHKIFLGGDMTNNSSLIPCFNFQAEQSIKKFYERHKINTLDVFKTCHHGGSGTNGKSICELTKPKYAIITNTDKWLDNWSTRQNFKDANENTILLQTDHYKYVFDFSKKEISYEKINDESLFIKLNMN